ncbi:hypothetical protein [Methylovulum psychrotolerans]|uniref:Uncharacterized protein n=2 Tax=Methylovulum psychrotolerans TaxID=1704499 RepID=A0A1Z4C2N2_9GAMM|nr:hypothetical protein [Methylovulum psychrotolerans]ASF47771.1 hypothetical protein CEK71_17810 [Methylovulum psychrotolerans]POZ49735.1 hypothetical protein AADEFJLK_04495 [Methylovulum psychrotolerans]
MAVITKGCVVLIEYHPKLDVSKDLAMVEKKAKAVARRYFIDCEIRLLAQLLAQADQARSLGAFDQPQGFVRKLIVEQYYV